MNKFDRLLEATECAVTRCAGWSFSTSDENYDTKSLLLIAEVSDVENPADKGSFYVVSPSGAIGFCEDGEDIDWLFLSDSSADEDLPTTYQAGPQKKFCLKCGSGITSSARFCGKCGCQLQYRHQQSSNAPRNINNP